MEGMARILKLAVNIVLMTSVLFCRLPRSAAGTVQGVMEKASNTWRIETFNALPHELQLDCYSNAGNWYSSEIASGGNDNITYQSFKYWCCDFTFYAHYPEATLFSSFLVSNAYGRISKDPEIDCGTRCTWKADPMGFSVFHNGHYRRLHGWISKKGVDDSNEEASSNFACNLA